MSVIASGVESADLQAPERASIYGWLVFALSFGLLISDYMARQVLNAVFPLLKSEWSLSDAQLGLLSGVVALMVGLLTFPLSLAADKWGRVRSLAAMAALWSVATLLCAMSANYVQMLAGRLLVGVGEAAYGSVGIAVVISVFPKRLRATLSATFMAGGLFGQVLGVAVGGQIAATHGWRVAFTAIGVAGLLLAIAYPLVISERRIAELGDGIGQTGDKSTAHLRSLIATRSVRFTYIASGLQLFAAGALPAWLPSYFGRYYAMPVNQGGRLAALFLLVCGVGMILCGAASDRVGVESPERKAQFAVVCSSVSALALALALALPHGSAQLGLLGVAMFLVAGTTGPAGAMVASLTPRALHGSAFATLTLAHNLIGLAPGPIVTGLVADSAGLLNALRILSATSLLASLLFLLAGKNYRADLARLSGN